jgi:hypothetical protein
MYVHVYAGASEFLARLITGRRQAAARIYRMPRPRLPITAMAPIVRRQYAIFCASQIG